MYKSLVRPLLFWFSPSMARRVFLLGLKTINRVPLLWYLVKFSLKGKTAARTLFGLDFVNPIGIASGVDWKGRFIDPLCDIGASYVTVGPLTLNGGRYCGKVRDVIDVIRKSPFNRGKLTVVDLQIDPMTEDEKKTAEFDRLYTLIYDFTDAAIINLQDIRQQLVPGILDSITTIRRFNDDYKPVLIQMNPEYTPEEEISVVKEILSFGIDGVVISGEQNAISRLRRVLEETNNLIPIIVSNGFTTSEQARELLENGVSLLSVRDGLFKEGPSLIKRTLKKLYTKQAD